MHYYHGHKNRKNWFECWIFKFQNHSESILFIPKIQYDEKRKTFITLSIIMNKIYTYSFLIDDFNAEDSQLSVRIKNCFFTERGCSLNLQTEDLKIKGRIDYELNSSNAWYDDFTSFASFYLHHKVVSPSHFLKGSLTINSREWNFDEGMGYIEMNWGKMDASSLIWNQSLWQADKINSISVLAYQFPLFSLKVKTCMLSIYLEEHEAIFMTPIHAKILKMNSDELIVSQNEYRFELKYLKEDNAFTGKIQYRLYTNEECVFSKEIGQSSFYRQ